MKISIMGAGKLGRTVALQLISEWPTKKIIMFDSNINALKARVLDLQHAVPFFDTGSVVVCGNDYRDLAGSEIVIITAGKPKSDEIGREDLLFINAPIVREIAREIRFYAHDAIVIVATNPYDAMTWLVLKETGFHRTRVIGSGGELYCARFKSFISERLNIHPGRIGTMIIGGGAPCFTSVTTATRIYGGDGSWEPISKFLSEEEISELISRTRKAALEIIHLLQGEASYMAPAAAVGNLVKAMLQSSVVSAAMYAEGEYGVRGVVNLPLRLGQSGVSKIENFYLFPNEEKILTDAALHIQELCKRLLALVPNCGCRKLV